MADGGSDLERWAEDVIFGRAKGVGASLLRGFLWCLSHLYRGGVQGRLAMFRSGWKDSTFLGTAVIAIGNITMGGTGKTPVVERFARELAERGRRVAILSRGYKSTPLDEPQKWIGRKSGEVLDNPPRIVSDGKTVFLKAKHAGDEPFMLAKNLPGVAVLVDRDRVKSARFAIEELGADTILLDDGMQYLKLGHSQDVVLVDRNNPFGTGHIIPRGTLREPPRNLCRADYLFMTKCGAANNRALRRELRRYNPTAEILECTHGPERLVKVFGEGPEELELEVLDEMFVGAMSGIAVPESFEKLLKNLGASVVFHRTFPDHHNFVQKEVDDVMSRGVKRAVEMIVTTEKDAVRMLKPTEVDVPIYYLRIQVDILEGKEVWDRCVARICGDWEG